MPRANNIIGIASAAFALLVWGRGFRQHAGALLMDFSALEIMVARFVMAWVVLCGMEVVGWRRGRSPRTGGTRLARGASPTR